MYYFEELMIEGLTDMSLCTSDIERTYCYPKIIHPQIMLFSSDRPILIFYNRYDTDYLYVYVPDNWYAEPIFIYCYKVNKQSEVSPFFALVFPPFSHLNNNKQLFEFDMKM